MLPPCACGLGVHSLAQSAKCDGLRKYGAAYKPPTRKKKKGVLA